MTEFRYTNDQIRDLKTDLAIIKQDTAKILHILQQLEFIKENKDKVRVWSIALSVIK